MKISFLALPYFYFLNAVSAEDCPYKDDWNFRVGGQNGRGCGWVGNYPEERCLESTGAKQACLKTCCGINEDPPVPPPTPPPQEAPVAPPPPEPKFESAAPIYNQYDVCTDFCKAALTTCEGAVDWVTNTYPNPHSRHMDGGAGTEATGKPSEQFDACHDTCMGWVYWRQDAQLSWEERWFQGYSIGDSLNCRMNHIGFASGAPTGNAIFASETESAARHCNHITPDGGWVCSDYRNSDNKTPAQLYKEAVFTKHRMGDCWLAADDKIADCHRKALTDANVDQNLLWLPDDIEYIFLHVNSLTKVPDLSRFTELKGVYLESNAIDTLNSDDFESNTKLEIINLNNNFITEFPSDLLATLTELKALFFSWNYITSLPATAFQNSLDLELLILVENQLSGFAAGTFDNLASLKVLAFGQQGKGPYWGQMMDESGIPDGLFDDLISLEFMSSFINNIGTLKSDWFGDWSANLEEVVFFMYQLGPKPAFVIEDGVFDKLPNLIQLALYTNGNVVSPADVSNNPKLRTVLYGNQFSILGPLPEPALFKEDLIQPPNPPKMIGNFKVEDIEAAFGLDAGSLKTEGEMYEELLENNFWSDFVGKPTVLTRFEALEPTARNQFMYSVTLLGSPLMRNLKEMYFEYAALGCFYSPKDYIDETLVELGMGLCTDIPPEGLSGYALGWYVAGYLDEYTRLLYAGSDINSSQFMTEFAIVSIDNTALLEGEAFGYTIEGPTYGEYANYLTPAAVEDTDFYGNFGKIFVAQVNVDMNGPCPEELCGVILGVDLSQDPPVALEPPILNANIVDGVIPWPAPIIEQKCDLFPCADLDGCDAPEEGVCGTFVQ